MMMLNVYKMNKWDWVAAKSAKEAVDYYVKETGFQWIPLDETKDGMPYECNMDEPFVCNRGVKITFRELVKANKDYGLEHELPYVERPYRVLTTDTGGGYDEGI